MSDNMVSDLAKGASGFSTIWKWLLRMCLLGGFLAVVAAFTGLMAIWWFAIWVIPLSTVLFAKATLSYVENMDDNERSK